MDLYHGVKNVIYKLLQIIRVVSYYEYLIKVMQGILYCSKPIAIPQ